MTLIANLDAAIEEHYAETDQYDREIQIFGKVWKLIPDLTTAQINPLAQIQAAAEFLSDPTTGGAEEARMAIQMLASINPVLASIICEEERTEFERIIARKGIPVAIASTVVEAIFTAYDAAPLRSGATAAPQHPTNTPLLASTTVSGNSSETVGQTSNLPSNPPQPTTPQPVPPVMQVVPALTQSAPEPALQAYESPIPKSILDVPLASSEPSHGGS